MKGVPWVNHATTFQTLCRPKNSESSVQRSYCRLVPIMTVTDRLILRKACEWKQSTPLVKGPVYVVGLIANANTEGSPKYWHVFICMVQHGGHGNLEIFEGQIVDARRRPTPHVCTWVMHTGLWVSVSSRIESVSGMLLWLQHPFYGPWGTHFQQNDCPCPTVSLSGD